MFIIFMHRENGNGPRIEMYIRAIVKYYNSSDFVGICTPSNAI